MLRKKEPLKKKGLVIKNTCKRGYVLKEIINPLISKECHSNKGMKKLQNTANDKTTVIFFLLINGF